MVKYFPKIKVFNGANLGEIKIQKNKKTLNSTDDISINGKIFLRDYSRQKKQQENVTSHKENIFNQKNIFQNDLSSNSNLKRCESDDSFVGTKRNDNKECNVDVKTMKNFLDGLSLRVEQ